MPEKNQSNPNQATNPTSANTNQKTSDVPLSASSPDPSLPSKPMSSQPLDKRIKYTKDQMLALRSSPLVQTPESLKEHEELLSPLKRKPLRSGTNDSVDESGSTADHDAGDDGKGKQRRPPSSSTDRRTTNVIDGRFGANQPQSYQRSANSNANTRNTPSADRSRMAPRTGNRSGPQTGASSYGHGPAWMSSNQDGSWKSGKNDGDDDDKYKGMDEMQKFRAQMKEREAAMKKDETPSSQHVPNKSTPAHSQEQKSQPEIKKEAGELQKTKTSVEPTSSVSLIPDAPISVDALFSGPLAPNSDGMAMFNPIPSNDIPLKSSRVSSGSGRSRFEKLFSSNSPDSGSFDNLGPSTTTSTQPFSVSDISSGKNQTGSVSQNSAPSHATQQDREGMQRIMAMLSASSGTSNGTNTTNPTMQLPARPPFSVAKSSESEFMRGPSASSPDGPAFPASRPNQGGPQTQLPQGNPDDPKHLEYLTQLLRSTIKINGAPGPSNPAPSTRPPPHMSSASQQRPMLPPGGDHSLFRPGMIPGPPFMPPLRAGMAPPMMMPPQFSDRGQLHHPQMGSGPMPFLPVMPVPDGFVPPHLRPGGMPLPPHAFPGGPRPSGFHHRPNGPNYPPEHGPEYGRRN